MKNKESGENKVESSNTQGYVSSTYNDGETLYSKATIVAKGMK